MTRHAVVLKSVTVLPLARINTDKRSAEGEGHDPVLKWLRKLSFTCQFGVDVGVKVRGYLCTITSTFGGGGGVTCQREKEIAEKSTAPSVFRCV